MVLPSSIAKRLTWLFVQVFLGQTGGRDTDGNALPRLVYVSREKRPGFNHHKKAGAMNSLVRTPSLLLLSVLPASSDRREPLYPEGLV